MIKVRPNGQKFLMPQIWANNRYSENSYWLVHIGSSPTQKGQAETQWELQFKARDLTF